MPQEQIRVAKHSCPVIGLPVQEDYRVPISGFRLNAPTAQHGTVIGTYHDVIQFSMIARSNCLR